MTDEERRQKTIAVIFEISKISMTLAAQEAAKAGISWAEVLCFHVRSRKLEAKKHYLRMLQEGEEHPQVSRFETNAMLAEVLRRKPL